MSWELAFGRNPHGPQVGLELLSMSAATVDRYFAPEPAQHVSNGKPATTESPLLRSSIMIRKTEDEIEVKPG